jgi:4-hydroxyphenylpyruvate dioxygenase
VRFLEANDAYFSDVRDRLAFLDLPWDALQQLGILVDNEDDGHLLQLFTEPITDRPTVFIEIIERSGATGFGEGNFKALFESIEREQERRGNL